MRFTLCPAEQHGIIKTEMRRDDLTAFNVSDFEAARYRSRPILMQKRM